MRKSNLFGEEEIMEITICINGWVLFFSLIIGCYIYEYLDLKYFNFLNKIFAVLDGKEFANSIDTSKEKAILFCLSPFIIFIEISFFFIAIFTVVWRRLFIGRNLLEKLGKFLFPESEAK